MTLHAQTPPEVETEIGLEIDPAGDRANERHEPLIHLDAELGRREPLVSLALGREIAWAVG